MTASEVTSKIRLVTDSAENRARPTGSAACGEVLQYLLGVCEKEVKDCGSCTLLENGAGLVVVLGKAQKRRSVLVYTHIDFHPSAHKQNAEVSKDKMQQSYDTLFDNSGGVAMLVLLVVKMAAIYRRDACDRRCLHVAFLTGGDVYHECDQVIDARRRTGFGLDGYVTWAETQTVHHMCAINLYASLHERAQTCFELEQQGRSDKFVYFHILGAGYALGLLNVSRNKQTDRVSLQLPSAGASLFDTALLRAYNKHSGGAVVIDRNEGGTYLVPGCLPPLEDHKTQRLQRIVKLPLVQIDAPLCVCDKSAGSVEGSGFEHVSNMLIHATDECVGTCTDEYFVACELDEHVYDDNEKDIEMGSNDNSFIVGKEGDGKNHRVCALQ